MCNPTLLCLQLQARELELLEVRQELKELQESTAKCEEGRLEKETQMASQQQMLEERVGNLARQNDVLHEEAERVSWAEGRM